MVGPRGHHQRALKVLKRTSRWNSVTLPPDDELYKIFLDVQMEDEASKNVESETMRGNSRRFCSLPKLLSTSKIRLVTGMLLVNLFISSLVFSGLSLSGNSYKLDPYLYIVVGGLMEVPSYSLTAPLIKRLGRKRPTIIGYFVSGFTILTLAFIPLDKTWVVFTLAMLGKMSNSSSYMIMFVYMSELFPTEVRLQGVGLNVAMERVGSIVAPYITDVLGPIVSWLPSVIFGGTSFVAGLVLLPLPETLGLPMRETISDLEVNYQRPSKPSVSLDGEESMKLTD